MEKQISLSEEMWQRLWRNHVTNATFIKGFQYSTYEYQYYDGTTFITLGGGSRFHVGFPEMDALIQTIERGIKDDKRR